MVAILEVVKLITKQRFINISNPFGEVSCCYLENDSYLFRKGMIYGIVCEHGGAGDAISALLSNHIIVDKEQIYIDENLIEQNNIGWYVGKSFYTNGIIKKEISVRKLLIDAISKTNIYTMTEIMRKFNLTSSRLDYGLSKCSWEKWRMSLAIGYAKQKKIFCFPWMNSLLFYDCMYNSAVYYFFESMKQEGAIIILPTSKRENLEGMVDEILEVDGERFKRCISNISYYKNNR